MASVDFLDILDGNLYITNCINFTELIMDSFTKFFVWKVLWNLFLVNTVRSC